MIGTPRNTLSSRRRSWTPWSVSLLALALACAPAQRSDGHSTTRPNVVLIVVDTLRADHTFGDDRRVETSAVDALGRDGIVFEHAFSHAPITLPSHTALFSSRPAFETGVLNNGQPVPDDLPLLAEWMGKYGYDTRAVISLGTLTVHGNAGVTRGFDVFDQDLWHMSRGPDVLERVQPLLDELGDERPFFLFAHFSDPHEPYNAHKLVQREAEIYLDGELLDTASTSDMTVWRRDLVLDPGVHRIEIRSEDRFQTRWIECLNEDGGLLQGRWEQGVRLLPSTLVRYALRQDAHEPRLCKIQLWINDALGKTEKILRYRREVEFVDRYVGDLISVLKLRGLYDDTLIVFTSDHGEGLAERGHVGHIQHLYDEQIHVPLIIKLPQGDAGYALLAERAQQVVPHMDVAPTLLELIGLPPLPDQRGRSLLRGGSGLVLAETHRPQARQDVICLRDLEYKLIYVAEEERFEMYDLLADPDERVDVFATHGRLRRGWVLELVNAARFAERGGSNMEDLKRSVRHGLEALGYGG